MNIINIETISDPTVKGNIVEYTEDDEGADAVVAKIPYHHDFEPEEGPRYVVIQIDDKGLKAVHMAQKLLHENSVLSVVSLSGVAYVQYFNEDGDAHDVCAMNHDGDVSVLKGAIFVTDKTKHGNERVYSEPVAFPEFNPASEFSISWDEKSIMDESEVFLTTSTARYIISCMKDKYDLGEDTGFAHIQELLDDTVEIPAAYHSIAESMGINQVLAGKDGDIKSNVFCEALRHEESNPETIESIVDEVLEVAETEGPGYWRERTKERCEITAHSSGFGMSA